MDAITLAVATSAVVALGSKVAEGVASAAGKTLWTKIRAMLGFQELPPPATLAQSVAARLKDDDALARDVIKELQLHPDMVAGQLVGNVDAEKVIIIGQQNVTGDVNIDM